MNLLNKLPLTLMLFFFLFTGRPMAQHENTAKSNAVKDSLLWDSIVNWFQKDRDSFFVYINKGLEQYDQSANHQGYINCLLGLGNWYFQECEYEMYFEVTRKGVEKTLKYFGEKSNAYGNSLFALATYYRFIGDYDKSTELLEKIIRLDIADGVVGLATILHQLGEISRQRGDYEEALLYFNKVVQLNLSAIPIKDKGLVEISNYLSTAQVYVDINLLDTAVLFYQKIIPILERDFQGNTGFSTRYRMDLYNGLSEVFLRKKDFRQSITLAKKAISFSEADYPDIIAESNTLIGRAYSGQKNYDKAIRYFNKALEEDQMTYQAFDRHTRLAIRYYWLGDTYEKRKEIEKSLNYFQKGLYHATNKFDYQTGYELPEVTDIIRKDRDLLDLIFAKAKVLLKKYHSEEGSFKDIESGFETCWLAHEFIRVLHQKFQAEGSKFSLSNKVLPIYELGVALGITLFEKTKEEKYLQRAWQMAECNKAVILQESLNEKLALGFGLLPDSLLDKEKRLKIQISYYEKLIAETAKENKKRIRQIEQWEETLFTLRRSHQTLVRQIEKKYPQYYSYKYDVAPIAIAELKSTLGQKKAVLLEYFIGLNNVYIFCIDAKEIRYFSFDQKSFRVDDIIQLRTLLTQEPRSDYFDEDAELFYQAGHQLYEQLVKLPLSELNKNVERIIIVPDGLVNYIPFEILLREKVTGTKVGYNIAQLHYLMEDFAISYAYSASLLKKNKAKEAIDFKTDFVGFAPSFDNALNARNRSCASIDELSNLHCNDKEVDAIHQMMKGKCYIAEEANKETFLKEAPGNQIIHLATHACINQNNSKLNKIYFTDGDLTHFDLQNIQLNADLVVLSACNTGTGYLQVGEGVMSLSRSFHAAGCQSTLMSLWQVDDCITSELMISFYENLQRGENKDQAIQNARLNYLKKVDVAGAHPYYWGAFVLYGNVDALEKQFFFLSFWNGFVFCTILFGILLFVTLKKIRK